MIDRQKVIKGLEEAYRVIEDHVPERYRGYSRLACCDAITLLRDQARVLTVEEVVALPEMAWLDTGDMDRIVPVLLHGYMAHNGGYIEYKLLEATGCGAIKNYNREWRMWSGMPTDEERKAARWDE